MLLSLYHEYVKVSPSGSVALQVKVTDNGGAPLVVDAVKLLIVGAWFSVVAVTFTWAAGEQLPTSSHANAE